MPRWSNWSGKLRAEPAQLRFIRSEPDAQALVADAARRGMSLRMAGATHSHAPLVQHDGIIAEIRGLSGVISTDPTGQSAWVWAGTPIHSLGWPLLQAGLGLRNQGDIDQQAIAGATATGTHGTGRTLQNLSASVIGASLVLADGSRVTCNAEDESNLWQASRLHLGAFGIVTRLHLQLRNAYRLEEKSWTAPLEDILAEVDRHVADNRHFEFFWYPRDDQANAKTINETDAEPVYPLADEGERCAWSHEVLPNHRPHKHTEMEYSVPAENGVACMRDIARLLRSEFPDVRWPVEYRTLARDDVWLSSAFARDTVTISVHQDVNEDDEPYFRACEEIFLSYAGRPHWGKVNYCTGTALSGMHAAWDDWWHERDRVDPDGLFLNHYLRSLR